MSSYWSFRLPAVIKGLSKADIWVNPHPSHVVFEGALSANCCCWETGKSKRCLKAYDEN